MKRAVKLIIEEAWKLVRDQRARRLEKIEALRILASCQGIWIGDADERLMAPKQAFELRQARQHLVGKALGAKAARSKANRRNYLRRKIRTLETQELQTAEKGNNHGTVTEAQE
ncbi:MAG TPA: hypothetical protein VHX37_11340 [Acidobacteriaceae bacterium]|jgi:hypothetical protein|nr:hypothetical protein [Acidobacteriaceae bacterium]